MSVSIGFGCNVTRKAEFCSEFKAIAISYGYGLEEGVDFFESDVSKGISKISCILKWNSVFVLRSPIDNRANLAFAVNCELDKIELNHKAPLFFNFIIDLIALVRKYECFKFCIFFATEWVADDYVRCAYGNSSLFFSILRVPGHWQLRLLNPETGRFQNSDKFPFLFEFDLSSLHGGSEE